MTRFARSKGSKASNERVPEEATSWQIMKQQLEEKKQEESEAKKRKEFEAVRKANYKSFLEERENNVENEWTVFEGTSNKPVKSPKIKNKKQKMENLDDDEDEPELKELISKIEKVLEKEDSSVESKKKKSKIEKVLEKEDSSVESKKKKSKKKLEKEDVDMDNESDDAPDEVSAKIVSKITKTKLKLPKKVPLKIPSLNQPMTEVAEKKYDTVTADAKNIQKDRKGMKRKMNGINENEKKKKPRELESIEKNTKKSKQNKDITNESNYNPSENNEINKNEPKSLEGLSEDQIKRIMKKREKRMRQFEKKRQFKAEAKEKALKEEQAQLQNNQKRQLPKPRDNKEHQRRKPNSEVEKMYINGIEIEIDYYDGFPIKREDADRLRKLRKEMISKGIPKSEVQIALKLERRKAEKNLAREKKKVCFNCRKSGHVLSECPELNERSSHEMIGTGICFKCGSTEHTHFECKVVKRDDYKFATCFICREQGHISRQCPDNQKGLYPKGGACRICGDVTHLKKDCPQFQAEQESHTLKLDTLEFNNVESLPEERGNSKVYKNKVNKVVKF